MLAESERTQRVSTVIKSWEPMRGTWREIVLGFGDVVGQGGAARLADAGVVIQKKRWENFISYVNAAAILHRGTKLYGVRYEQFGWRDGGFVLGSTLLRRKALPEPIHGGEEVVRRGQMMAPRGDAATWTAAADRLIGHEGMEAHAFMLLCSFAAPLYHFTGEPGVTFVHGATRETAKGKTTIQEAGASVWGEPLGTSMVERDTLVAKFITLGTLNNLPVFFDELRFPTPDETKHYVLQATLGRDKQRGKAEGGLRADQLTWSTIHISAANLSLIDTVRADGSEVAQAARIFEFGLSLPADVKTTEGDALKEILKENRGTAGLLFMQHVVDNHDAVRAAVKARMQSYEQSMAAGPDERFVLRLFACVDAAADLVLEHDLLHFDKAKMMAWAVGVQRGNATRLADETKTDAAVVVSQMMNDLQQNMLVMAKTQEVGKPAATTVPLRSPHGELKARLDMDTRTILADCNAVRRWMQEHNYSFSAIQGEMSQLGVLKHARVRKTLGAGTTYAGGQTWCWQIDGAHALMAGLVESATTESNVIHLRTKG
jgi:hypothetical protein